MSNNNKGIKSSCGLYMLIYLVEVFKITSSFMFCFPHSSLTRIVNITKCAGDLILVTGNIKNIINGVGG